MKEVYFADNTEESLLPDASADQSVSVYIDVSDLSELDAAAEEKQEIPKRECGNRCLRVIVQTSAITFGLYCTAAGAANDATSLMMSRVGKGAIVWTASGLIFLSTFGLSFEETIKNTKYLFSCQYSIKDYLNKAMIIPMLISAISATCAFFQTRYGINIVSTLYSMSENLAEGMGDTIGFGNALAGLFTGGASLFMLAGRYHAGNSIWEYGSPFSRAGFYLGYPVLAQASINTLQDIAAIREVLSIENWTQIYDYFPLVLAGIDAAPFFIFNATYYIERIYSMIDMYNEADYCKLFLPLSVTLLTGVWLEYLYYSSNFNTFNGLIDSESIAHAFSGLGFAINVFSDAITLDHALRLIGSFFHKLFTVNASPEERLFIAEEHEVDVHHSHHRFFKQHRAIENPQQNQSRFSLSCTIL